MQGKKFDIWPVSDNVGKADIMFIFPKLRHLYMPYTGIQGKRPAIRKLT